LNLQNGFLNLRIGFFNLRIGFLNLRIGFLNVSVTASAPLTGDNLAGGQDVRIVEVIDVVGVGV